MPQHGCGRRETAKDLERSGCRTTEATVDVVSPPGRVTASRRHSGQHRGYQETRLSFPLVFVDSVGGEKSTQGELAAGSEKPIRSVHNKIHDELIRALIMRSQPKKAGD